MARTNTGKKVLLLEPNYSNKFPPIGLMKISTYHKQLGYEVVFYKGNLKQFVIERIADKCTQRLSEYDNSIDWHTRKDVIVEYIRTRKKEFFDAVGINNSDAAFFLQQILVDAKDYYWNNTWKQKQEREWDRVFVTTLFTFYWDITIETIEFAKLLVKPKGLLQVGGVLASIQADEIEKATGIKPHKGIMNTPGELDKGDDKIIDNLPLDYSILDEIEYRYSMSNAFYGYTTRGCIRKCPFCAVPILEPIYNQYIPLKERIDLVRETYGDQKDLLLMDNNVLASKHLPDIIKDIIDCGFAKGAKFSQPDMLEIAIRNLRNSINDRAYIRKSQTLMMEFYEKLKGDEQYEIYKILKTYHLTKLLTTKKENLLLAYEELKDTYKKHLKPSSKLRFIDFNQGVDARLFNEENVKLLASTAIRPLRVAFDDMKTREAYEKAIRLSVKAGIRDFSNYLLYNFKDTPIDLYRRLKINVDLCEELGVSIYSFPMKYHPIRKESGDETDFSHNRDYIGVEWNRKYIRAVQAILNSTKGKIGRGQSFFYKAFGKDEATFLNLLEMPETFILYRYFFEWLGDTKHHKASVQNWRKCFDDCKKSLSESEWDSVLQIIHKNEFGQKAKDYGKKKVDELLAFYTNYRKDIITPGNELYSLKQEYDSIPSPFNKRKSQK